MKIRTENFTTDPSSYIREILWRWVMRNVWLFLMVVVICIALAYTIDTAFLFVAAMVSMLVLPFVIVFVYFNYGLKPKALRWGLKRNVEIDGDKMKVNYAPDEMRPKTPEADVIELSKIRGLKINRHNDVLSIGKHLDDFIIISDDAFPEEADMRREQFHEFLYQTIQRNSLPLRS